MYDKHTLEKLYEFDDIDSCVNGMNNLNLGKGEFKKKQIYPVCRGDKPSQLSDPPQMVGRSTELELGGGEKKQSPLPNFPLN